MSKTGDESDDLEFESADEENPQNGEDLSDLDLQEILDEDEKTPPPTSKSATTKEPTSEEKSQTQPPPSQPTAKQDPPKVEEIETKIDKLEIIDQEKQTAEKQSDEIKLPEVKPTKSDIEEPASKKASNLPDESSNKKSDEKAETKTKTTEAKNDWFNEDWGDQDEEEEKEDMSVKQPIMETNKPKIPSEPKPDPIIKQDANNRNDNKSAKIEEKSIPKETRTEQGGGGFGWGGWSKLGTNLLASAATITSQMIETVEATLGAPDPSELAARIAKSQAAEAESEPTAPKNDEHPAEQAQKGQQQQQQGGWEFENESDWFSMDKIASTGTTLFTGSLDVLESVGKKTLEIIHDKDPNFAQTREILKKVPIGISQKPNLSQLLREAQSQNSDNKNLETSDSTGQKEGSSSKQQQSGGRNTSTSSSGKKYTFGLYFDEFKGSPNLEALEMLSSQANVKLDMLAFEKPLSKYPSEVREDMKIVDELFDARRFSGDDDDDDKESVDEDEEDFNTNLERDLNELFCHKEKSFDLAKFETLITSYAKMSSSIVGVERVIDGFRKTSKAARNEELTPNELLNECIKCFALVASSLMELFHKSAESLYLEIENPKSKLQRNNVLDIVKAIYSITKLSIKSVSLLSDDFSKTCKQNSNRSSGENPKHLITDIYLEASNSSTFISDAFLLLAPILKFLLLKNANS